MLLFDTMYLIQTIMSESLLANQWQTIDAFESPPAIMEHIESPVIPYHELMIVRCAHDTSGTIVYAGIHSHEVVHNITSGTDWMKEHGFGVDEFNKDYAESWRTCKSATSMLMSLATFCSRRMVLTALLDTSQIMLSNDKFVESEFAHVRRRMRDGDIDIDNDMLRIQNMREEDMDNAVIYDFVSETYACLTNWLDIEECGSAIYNLCIGLANGDELEANKLESKSADILRSALNFREIAKEIVS